MKKQGTTTKSKSTATTKKKLKNASDLQSKQKRQLAPATYTRFLPKKLRTKRVKKTYPKLPKARLLFASAVSLLLSQWKGFTGILAVYAVGLLLLVVGFSLGSDFSEARQSLNTVFQDKSTFSNLFMQVFFLFSNSSSTTGQTAGIYQSVLLVLCSLALIWGLREAKQGRDFTTKQSFYSGMTPLVPFLLTVVFISVQLLPLTIGAYLYNLVTINGIVVSFPEKFVAFCLFAALCFWSLRMLTSSVFTPYISTLPGMQPLAAFASAKELVPGRRLVIWRKLIFLPVALVVLLALAIAPFIVLLPATAPWVFFVLTCVAFAITHAYLYVLYRELIRE